MKKLLVLSALISGVLFSSAAFSEEQTLTPLEQTLVDTIKGASAVTGDVYAGVKSVTGKAIDFAQQQIPDVIEQLLRWNFAKSLIAFLFGIIAIGIVSFSIFCLQKKGKWEDFDINTVSGMMVIFIGTPSLSLVFCNLTWLQIWIAPKVYLLEYAAKLIK